MNRPNSVAEAPFLVSPKADIDEPINRASVSFMSDDVKLRVYGDFNSCAKDARGVYCWCRRHGVRPLDEVAARLEISDGMPVTLYYEDERDEFEYDAVLGHCGPPLSQDMWIALFDENTFRRIR